MIANIGINRSDDTTIPIKILSYPQSRLSEWFFKSPMTGAARNIQLAKDLVVNAEPVYETKKAETGQAAVKTAKESGKTTDNAYTVTISDEGRKQSLDKTVSSSSLSSSPVSTSLAADKKITAVAQKNTSYLPNTFDPLYEAPTFQSSGPSSGASMRSNINQFA